MTKIDGKKIAENILSELEKHPVPKKFLAVFLVGSDAASKSFIAQKERVAKRLGVDFRVYAYEETITNDVLRERIHQVVDASKCGGALIQLPLPPHLNGAYVANAISEKKDVDILSDRARGAFYAKRSTVFPPAVGAFLAVMGAVGKKLEDTSSVAVVGQGFLVGRPISVYCMGQVPRVLAFDKGDDLSVLKGSDVVVLGTGEKGLIKGSMVADGALVVDFGYGVGSDGVVGGDFDPRGGGDGIVYTPTPGGTGPILVAKLFENFYQLYNK